MDRALTTNNGLSAVNDYTITVTAGRGVLAGAGVAWPQTTVTCPSGVDSLVYVNVLGRVVVRPLGSPPTLPLAPELPLQRCFSAPAVYGPGIYSVADARTFQDVFPRSPLRLRERVLESVQGSGPWAGAVKVNAIGYINWYFANLGLLPFVAELPDVVEAHLNVQVAKFYGPSGTHETGWTALHGTPWSNYHAWAYDVEPDDGSRTTAQPGGTFTPGKQRRADSHDSYGATFAILACAYQASGPRGRAWFAANVEAVKTAIYYNISLRLQPVPNAQAAAGYWTSTFQDKAVYPVSYTMDNAEVWAALHATNRALTELGGHGAFVDSRAQEELIVLRGIQAAWQEDNGGYLRYLVDLGAGAWGGNALGAWYPDLTVHPVALMFELPLHPDPTIARLRDDAALNQLGRAPRWWRSRDYDTFPWGYAVVPFARRGHRSLTLDWLNFLQRHVAHDSAGYFQIHDVGMARMCEQALEGRRGGLDFALYGSVTVQADPLSLRHIPPLPTPVPYPTTNGAQTTYSGAYAIASQVVLSQPYDLVGLSLATKTLYPQNNQSVSPGAAWAVWSADGASLIAQTAAGPGGQSGYAAFASPVHLAAGTYLIGSVIPDGTPGRTHVFWFNGNSTPEESTWPRQPGVTYPPGQLKVRDSQASAFATISVDYRVCLQFYTGGVDVPKGVVNALDPADFPVVAGTGELTGAGLALLDDGVNPPRFVRRRPDGTVWYGPTLSSTP